MKNIPRCVITRMLWLLVCLLFAVGVEASRPSASDVARRKCLEKLFELGRTLDHLTPAQMVELTGRRKGVQPVVGNVLSLLVQHKPELASYFNQPALSEDANQLCRYYLIFNLDRPVFERTFVLLDNQHGFKYDIRDEKFDNLGPQSLFREFCTLFDAAEASEEFSKDFLEETEYQKKFRLAKARDTGWIAIIARYWFLFVVFGFLDFYFIDLGYMKDERDPVKMYGLGLHLVCIIIALSIVPIHYTGNPVPGLRDFSHLPFGSYPQGLHFLVDVILVSSFSWWAASLVAVFSAWKFNCSTFVPLIYLLVAPMTLAMSESPFGGTQRIAFPVFGLLLMLVNAIYIKIKYRK